MNDSSKNNFHILFVGSGEVSNNNHRITVVKNLPNNIENEKELLTFTAWYAIVKNNLFSQYEYICILEYDVKLEPSFEQELIDKCEMKVYDVISFIQTKYSFMIDIKENIMNFFLNKKGITFKNQAYGFLQPISV